ncbi:MAG: CoA transferase [Rhodanobacter sp.]
MASETRTKFQAGELQTPTCSHRPRPTVPCAPVNTLDRVFDDSQIKARWMQIELSHPMAGSVPGVASPVRFSATPVQYRHAAPELGRHTQDVLQELYILDGAELAELDQGGAIEWPAPTTR